MVDVYETFGYLTVVFSKYESTDETTRTIMLNTSLPYTRITFICIDRDLPSCSLKESFIFLNLLR